MTRYILMSKKWKIAMVENTLKVLRQLKRRQHYKPKNTLNKAKNIGIPAHNLKKKDRETRKEYPNHITYFSFL